MITQLIILICSLFPTIHAVSVRTKYGTMEGVDDSENGYTVFYGVPYAGDVSGENRFKVAPEVLSLPEGFVANNTGIICAHPTSEGMAGQEDCLTLDIFTKNVSEKVPVFVWLNGGYSKPVDKQFSFKSLVEAGAVVVSLNHRLSIFGFLCLGNENAPGNAGLKDVIRGLHWVKENIENFGGDPNNVILIGHGEGAAIVDLVTLSPQSENLVHKAIALSGSGVAPWAVVFDPLNNARTFSAALNLTDDDDDHLNLTNKLAKADLQLLSDAINKFTFTNNTILFAACIEKNESSSFLKEAPMHTLKSGNYKKLPYIASLVKNEGTMKIDLSNDSWSEKMGENFNDFLPADLDYGNDTEIASKIRLFYFGSAPVDKNAERRYLEYKNDVLVTVPVLRGVRERVETNDSQVYLLYFNYNQEKKDPIYPFEGLKHGDILDYIFDGESVDTKPKQHLIKRLIAFANTGEPTDKTDPRNNVIGSVYWAPLSKEYFEYFEIFGTTNSVSDGMQNTTFENTEQLWKGQTYRTPESIWPQEMPPVTETNEPDEVTSPETNTTSPATIQETGLSYGTILGTTLAFIILVLMITCIALFHKKSRR